MHLWTCGWMVEMDINEWMDQQVCKQMSEQVNSKLVINLNKSLNI